MSSFLAGLKHILLWSYQRGSWQYDILCILILAFIFLTPSDWFNPRSDEPRLPSVHAPHRVEKPNLDGLVLDEDKENSGKEQKNAPKP